MIVPGKQTQSPPTPPAKEGSSESDVTEGVLMVQQELGYPNNTRRRDTRMSASVSQTESLNGAMVML